MKDRTPYVYELSWTQQNTHYIGCRYGKGVHPDDLLDYKTSSKLARPMWLFHGPPDVIRTHPCVDIESTKKLEARLIELNNAIDDPHYLNRGVFQDGKFKCSADDEDIKKEKSISERHLL